MPDLEISYRFIIEETQNENIIYIRETRTNVL